MTEPLTAFGSSLVAILIAALFAPWLRRGGHHRQNDRSRLSSRWAILVPLGAAAAGFVGGLHAHSDLEAASAALFAGVGAVLAWIDADVQRLPQALTSPMIATLGLLTVVGPLLGGDASSSIRTLLCAVAVGLFYAAMTLFTMGPGDVALGIGAGLLLGQRSATHALWGTVAAFLVAALVGLALMALRRMGPRDHLAFGPAIVAGAFITLAAF